MTKLVKVILRVVLKVFWFTLFWYRGPPRTSLDSTSFNYLIIPDKFILGNKKSYLVNFENFHLFRFLEKNVNVLNMA